MLVQNDQYANTSATLEQIISQITTIQNEQRSLLERERSTASPSVKTSLSDIDEVLTSATTSTQSDSLASTDLRITTSIASKKCDWTCNCQCHVRTATRTPQWLSAVVGTLFYSSTNTPRLEVRPCNSSTCFRAEPSSSSRFTYYFPAWMMRWALVYSTWDNLDGKSSSWVCKMPMEIPYSSQCWHFIQQGASSTVQDLLQRREMSPYDIGPDGVSVLQVSDVQRAKLQHRFMLLPIELH